MRIEVVANAVGWRLAPVGDESVTLKLSFPSSVESAMTGNVMSLVASPIAKFTTPDRNLPPTKSPAAAVVTPEPLAAEANFTLEATLRLPSRVTVNVNGVGVLPVPSDLIASLAEIVIALSSLRIVPVAA